MQRLKPGDKVAIVSLSSGVLGEEFVRHELDLGIKRLKEFGLMPVFMDNALKGLDFISSHPEKRADDLKQAFADPEIKGIISAIGGNDSYKIIPYLANDKEFLKSVKNNPKIFTGYSDTTTIHLFLNSLGVSTFYGPAFLTDFAELDNEMLPYTKQAVDYLFEPKIPHQILSSNVWYEERKDFSPAAVGTSRISHNETNGYKVLRETKNVQGELFGGCIEVISRLTGNFKIFPDEEFENIKKVVSNYPVLPKPEEFKNKILFLETSDSKAEPEKYRNMILVLKNYGIFDHIKGLLIGKPMDEAYIEEYNQILLEELGSFDFPIMTNLNFGHSFPRTILPFDAIAELDTQNKTLTLLSSTIK